MDEEYIKPKSPSTSIPPKEKIYERVKVSKKFHLLVVRPPGCAPPCGHGWCCEHLQATAPRPPHSTPPACVPACGRSTCPSSWSRRACRLPTTSGLHCWRQAEQPATAKKRGKKINILARLIDQHLLANVAEVVHQEELRHLQQLDHLALPLKVHMLCQHP